MDKDTKSLAEWQGAAQGTNAGVTFTKAAPTNTGRKHVVDYIEAYGDAAAVLTVESPSATILHKQQFGAAFNVQIGRVDIEGAKDQALLVKISASTAFCGVNVEGHEEQA